MFAASDPGAVRAALKQFVADASESQLRAWADSVPALQREAGLVAERATTEYSALLEYKLPLEERRTDALFLVGGPVIVLELKGKATPSQADLDQAAGYARDLRAYHRHCETRQVQAVLVPMRRRDPPELIDDVWVCSPRHLHELVDTLIGQTPAAPVTAEEFVSEDAYRPLPSIVQAARELFFSRDVRNVWRARAATTPAVEYISAVAHEAAQDHSRHLILITGVPGAGKTLVGMRAVHSPLLDDLAVARAKGKPTSPALFLSGNGPLVEVLQFALRAAGGDGKTFVRSIKTYFDSHVPRPERVPDQHMLVFDEAQRAFTPDKVQELHEKWPVESVKSEPELMIQLAERIPQWSVVVGLIGSGQEIHVGEEGGLGQWRDALLAAPQLRGWTLHAPLGLREALQTDALKTQWTDVLNLDSVLRFHLAADLHRFVRDLLEPHPDRSGALPGADRDSGQAQWNLAGLKRYVTRDLETAKAYLRERYGDQPDARFGIVASSKDKHLVQFGIANDYQSTKRVRLGPWYLGGDQDVGSCRQLASCVTEFGAQGLELDMALVAWGTDLRRAGGVWDASLARGYKRGSIVRDPFQLRINAYRVLLTRGRDGMVVFVPRLGPMDETWEYLRACGFRELAG